jgi:hypothetical protein
MSFRGEGYDEVFISKTRETLESLKNTPDEKSIYVIDGCDDVCRYCPNRNGELCRNETQIAGLDSSFSKILDVQQHDTYSFSEIYRRTRNKLTAREFEEICHECQWFQICKNNLWP